MFKNTLFVTLPYAVLLITVGLAITCTSARNRDDRTNLLQGMRLMDNERQTYLKTNMKSGDIYYEFKPVMHVDAFRRNAEYINYLADEYAAVIFNSEIEKQEFLNEELKKEKKFTTIIISVHTNEGFNNILEKTGGGWQINLKYIDGTYVAPANISEMAPESREITYLKKYIRTFDRFSEFYRIDFPLPGFPKGNGEYTSAGHDSYGATLSVKGINGSTYLNFP